MNEPAREQWPEGVEELTIADLSRLGLDESRKLYWDGKEIVLKRMFELTLPQKIMGGIITFAAVVGGLGAFTSGLHDGYAILCERGVHGACPVKVKFPGAPASQAAPASTQAPPASLRQSKPLTPPAPPAPASAPAMPRVAPSSSPG